MKCSPAAAQGPILDINVKVSLQYAIGHTRRHWRRVSSACFNFCGDEFSCSCYNRSGFGRGVFLFSLQDIYALRKYLETIYFNVRTLNSNSQKI